MGAGQSRDAEGAEAEVKTSYYELLGVERHATEDELKKAYRRKALELHPDRNYGDEETATKTFAEVQAAYEVLSDPQERAWYDSHESAILRGDDGSAGQDTAPSYQNIRVTTADDLARMVRKFNSNVDFSDAPSGFFGFIRETFEQLAKEEEVAADWENAEAREYPTFGHKDDEYDDVVKRFYSAWSNFSTVKGFAWRDKYRLSEAPDRWYRRRMEKENKASRQEGIKEFNDAVRSLVAFVRKRDPRYVPTTQSEEDRQKVLRDAAQAQAQRARAANAEKLNSEAVPDWAKYREPEELEESEEEEQELTVFECVACNKVFKSEKQWEAHEKSKKHQKAVYTLQKKMRKENAHLDLHEGDMSSGVATPDVEDDEDEEDVLDDIAAEVEDQEARDAGHDDGEDGPLELDESDEHKPPTNGNAEAKVDHDGDDDTDESEDSDYASAEAVRARLAQTTFDTPPDKTSDADTLQSANPNPRAAEEDGKEDTESGPTQPKLGKAKQKKAKKAAAAAATEEAANTQTCATCNASFPSKTRLFQHIKDHGHAALKPAASGGAKGKKAKSKR